MSFQGRFVTADLPGGQDVWMVEATYSYLDHQKQAWTIPAGTITDGASIPRTLWPLVGHPRETDIAAAACLHDLLYRYGCTTRQRADEILREGMQDLGAGIVKRNLVYAGVRLGGWLPWRNYRRRE